MKEYTHLTIELFRHVKDQVLELVSHHDPEIYKKETAPVDLKEDKKKPNILRIQSNISNLISDCYSSAGFLI
jgi:hypothetical protein